MFADKCKMTKYNYFLFLNQQKKIHKYQQQKQQSFVRPQMTSKFTNISSDHTCLLSGVVWILFKYLTLLYSKFDPRHVVYNGLKYCILFLWVVTSFVVQMKNSVLCLPSFIQQTSRWLKQSDSLIVLTHQSHTLEMVYGNLKFWKICLLNYFFFIFEIDKRNRKKLL